MYNNLFVHLFLFFFSKLSSYFTPGYNGYAYISGVCSSYGVSITKDNGPFKTADTAAHELGHKYDINA